ncbi:hypothetical protein BGW36DRAFT_425890 [Talaromyces proteolyticus]|uniref:Uncharacterized protein n=1 Tax=Talaromyces proteolyticus TaxID=1131652 RepID=A0AAD4KW26_9EURO|nr:uncharacterized protein BGW36DRAFT_425890 [Talaromyces proteolyticus]KAH8701094.1 hypothetical protein BGW36DRAFT_425890 [Talaromyces proteolyticus]
MAAKTVRIAGKDVEVGSFDRMDFVPFHEGPEVLPHDLLFHTLHSIAASNDRPAIVDRKTGYTATYQQLVSDIVVCRNRLRATLKPETIEAIRREREVSILLWSAGYEFTIGFFAVLALGAIAVPLSPHITVPEALHYSRTVAAHGMLTSSAYIPKAKELQQHLAQELDFKILGTTPLLKSPLIDMRTIRFQSGRVYDQNKPALVIFTSGSTGPPRGMGPHTRTIQFLPVHHATGLLFNTLPTLVAGGCVEFDQGNFDPGTVWERIRSGDLKTFSAVPTIYVRLLRHWGAVISQRPDKEQYLKALSEISYFASSTSALSRQTFTEWLKLSGKPISERYGGSEFGNVYINPPGLSPVPCSVGVENPASESKLADGDHGEILVRGPMLFAKYMNDPVATYQAFDSDGFYKTGDIGRREGNIHFIEGRASIDTVIKSGGYKISALDIEMELNSHPKVEEGIIVGVEDEEFGQRIAAAVVLKNPKDTLTLHELRQDLRASLSNYKLPTMLRVVPELKKTSTMKIPKKLIRGDLFGSAHPDIQRWEKGKTDKESRL